LITSPHRFAIEPSFVAMITGASTAEISFQEAS